MSEPIPYTPGPTKEATSRKYFERGSAEKLMGDKWRTMCFVLTVIIVVLAIAISQLIPLKTVEVYVASKQDSGRIIVEESTSNWVPDQDVVQYLLSEWVSNLVEVNAASWERTTARAVELTINAGTDQTRDFLRKPENNPALLINDSPTFVRTYERLSSNILKEGSSLIRFQTLSRDANNPAAKAATYAITINYIKIKPTTRKQAMANPTGLAIASFNISEESKK